VCASTGLARENLLCALSKWHILTVQNQVEARVSGQAQRALLREAQEWEERLAMEGEEQEARLKGERKAWTQKLSDAMANGAGELSDLKEKTARDIGDIRDAFMMEQQAREVAEHRERIEEGRAGGLHAELSRCKEQAVAMQAIIEKETEARVRAERDLSDHREKSMRTEAEAEAELHESKSAQRELTQTHGHAKEALEHELSLLRGEVGLARSQMDHARNIEQAAAYEAMLSQTQVEAHAIKMETQMERVRGEKLAMIAGLESSLASSVEEMNSLRILVANLKEENSRIQMAKIDVCDRLTRVEEDRAEGMFATRQLRHHFESEKASAVGDASRSREALRRAQEVAQGVEASLRGQVASLERALVEARESHQEVTHSHSKASTDLSIRVDELERELDEAKASTANIEASAKLSQVSAAEQRAGLGRQLEEAQREKTQVTLEMARLKAEEEESTEVVARLNFEVADLQEKIQRLAAENKAVALQSSRQDAASSRERAGSTMHIQKSNLAEAKVRARLEEKEEEIVALKAKVEAVHGENKLLAERGGLVYTFTP